jgi:hypothetical protein
MGVLGPLSVITMLVEEKTGFWVTSVAPEFKLTHYPNLPIIEPKH